MVEEAGNPEAIWTAQAVAPTESPMTVVTVRYDSLSLVTTDNHLWHRRAAQITNQTKSYYRNLQSQDDAVFPLPRGSSISGSLFKPFPHPNLQSKLRIFMPLEKYHHWRLNWETKLRSKAVSTHHSPCFCCIWQKNQCLWQYHAEYLMGPREFATIRNPKQSLERSADHSVCVA